MSLRSPSDPKELRTAIHAFYEPYAQGIVNFPRARVKPEAIDMLPAKTRPIAQALIGAWQRIDTDRAVHDALVMNVLKDPEASLFDEKGNPHRGMVVSQIGRNSLTEVVFTPAALDEHLIVVETTVIGPRSALEDYRENASVELADGRVITGGGFNETQTPDIEFPVPSGEGVLGHVVHFDARLGQVA